MALTHEQLAAYEHATQGEVAKGINKKVGGVIDAALNPGNIPFYGVVAPLVPESITTLGRNTISTVKSLAEGVTEGITGNEGFRNIVEAVETFIGNVCDYVAETLGIQTDRQKVIASVKKSAKEIDAHLNELPANIDRKAVEEGVVQGLRDAGSSISAIQAQIAEEGEEAIGKITGTSNSKANGVAAEVASTTYQRIYSNLMAKFDETHSGASGEDKDVARRQAHSAAAQVTGIYLSEDGTFQASKDANGHYFGMYGYIREGILQIEGGKSEIAADYRLGPTDDVARAARMQSAANSPHDATPDAPPPSLIPGKPLTTMGPTP